MNDFIEFLFHCVMALAMISILLVMILVIVKVVKEFFIGGCK